VPNAQNGVFTVLKSSGGSHTINFGVNGDPSCACKDWRKWRIPCKHFLLFFVPTINGDGIHYHIPIYRVLTSLVMKG